MTLPLEIDALHQRFKLGFVRRLRLTCHGSKEFGLAVDVAVHSTGSDSASLYLPRGTEILCSAPRSVRPLRAFTPSSSPGLARPSTRLHALNEKLELT